MTDLKVAAQRALNLMDLTTLNDDDTDQKVIDLCRKAKSPAGLTAAVCIYPRFIPIARKTLREIGAADVRIATVTNFPHGHHHIGGVEPGALDARHLLVDVHAAAVVFRGVDVRHQRFARKRPCHHARPRHPGRNGQR